MGHGIKLLLACVYIPPSSPLPIYNDFCDAVTEMIELANFPTKTLIFGDFNLPHFDTNSATSGLSRQASDYLHDMSSLHSLAQINHIRNHRGVSLDLIFCSDHEAQVGMSYDWLISPEAHHPPLVVSLVAQASNLSDNSYDGYNLRKCNLPTTFTALQNVDMSFIHQSISIDEKFGKLEAILGDITVKASPKKKFGIPRFPKWFSGDLKRLIVEKKVAHKRFKESLNVAHYFEFSRLRDACKRLSRECYQRYLSDVESNISSNPRAFWGLVKAQRRSPDIPSSLYLDDEEASDATNICRLFSTYFSSVYSTPSQSAPNFSYTFFDHLCSITTTEEEVLHKLGSLDTTKGAGLDNIPPSVLHHCRSLLAKPLKELFNESLRKGIFPTSLKIGFIIPLHKSNDPCNIRNYRPITILPAIGKVLEGIVVDRLIPFLSKVIHPSQHGFVRGKSTISNLLLFQEYVLSAFRRNEQVDAVYIDMAKAFDKVDHAILISKLKGYGVADPLLSWIASYLRDRVLVVKIGPTTSDHFSSSSGVPQGSLLGPYLFILFVNDLLNEVSVNALKFADDVKLYSAISSHDDLLRIQDSLSAIEDWCTRNNMSINPSKCSCITFHRTKSPTIHPYSISGSDIPRSQSIKDLGVIFSNDMSFSGHIDYICNKSNKMLGFISRFSRGINNPYALRSLYCSLVRQLVEYASPVWSPYTLSNKMRLEALQRRFIRLVGVRMGFDYLVVPVDDLSRDLNLPSLSLRREVADVVMLVKVVNGYVNCSDLLAEIDFRVPTNTRSRDILSRRYHSTNFDFNSPLARFIRLGNKVASECDLFFDSIYQIRKRAPLLLAYAPAN